MVRFRRVVRNGPSEPSFLPGELVLIAAIRANRTVVRPGPDSVRVFERGDGAPPGHDALVALSSRLQISRGQPFQRFGHVELDYGGLVHLIDDETLSADQSVLDVSEALERLSSGDLQAAGECYERVVTHWRSIAALEHAN